MHIMDYITTATTGTLSPHILPIADLKQMLSHIEETLPPTIHLPVSSEGTLHFYRYLHTHILIANRNFLLLIDVPIQDWKCAMCGSLIQKCIDLYILMYFIHCSTHCFYT